MFFAAVFVFKYVRIIVFKANFLLVPYPPDIFLPSSKGPKDPVQPNILRAIVTIKGKMVNVVIIVTGAGEDESTMSKPSSKATVDHESQRNNRMNTKWNGKEVGGEKDGVFYWMKAGTRECGGVVALMVKLVDVFIKKPSNIRNGKPRDPPRM